MKWYFVSILVAITSLAARAETWTADNGNGTFTNPIFYEEFSDPDMIRVGDDFYLTGTTMHTMPGLPVLHSKDLVNWSFVCYAFERLDYGPEYRLENGKSIYGKGIWAPCFRYHNGTFYIFANVNGRKTQRFSAKDPAGPWVHSEMKRGFHDLSVLFDDDGKVYVIWGYQDIQFAQLTDQLDDLVPGTQRALFKKDDGMGEGSHFYKIDGKYYITSAWYAGRMRMPCARADKPDGPYEVNPEISADEDFGIVRGNRLADPRKGPPFTVTEPDVDHSGSLSMHQGGIIQTKTGQWWGFSMMDANSIGRVTCLSPVTWQDGWPYFGLPGNLKRTPRIWVKPDTGFTSSRSSPYDRNDDFSGPHLANVWQWNHVPDDAKWSLTERPGFLRLHSLPAPDFWNARNSLTQRAVGPESTPTAELDTAGMKTGDVAGLALLSFPYSWIGVKRTEPGFELVQYDHLTGQTTNVPFQGGRVWLRAHCDFLTEKGDFSYSTDGIRFQPLGNQVKLVFQLVTFQGVRYSLFNYNTLGVPGGHVDFDNFAVEEPHPQGITQPIPIGGTIVLANMEDGSVIAVKDDAIVGVPSTDPVVHTNASQFKVVDRQQGRISFQSVSNGHFITVTGLGEQGRVSLVREQLEGEPQLFQWIEMPRGDLLLLSLASDRYLRITANSTLTAGEPGAATNRKNGASLKWRTVSPLADPAQTPTDVQH